MHKKTSPFIILGNDINIAVPILLKNAIFCDTVWALTINKR